jgi:GTP cyclohydrolase II
MATESTTLPELTSIDDLGRTPVIGGAAARLVPLADAKVDKFVFCSCCNLPTEHGMLEMRVYRNPVTAKQCIAMVARTKHGKHTHMRTPIVPAAIGAQALHHHGLANINALVQRAQGSDAIVLRVHDQCHTSEIFGSQKCDCKQQLDLALATIAQLAGL